MCRQLTALRTEVPRRVQFCRICSDLLQFQGGTRHSNARQTYNKLNNQPNDQNQNHFMIWSDSNGTVAIAKKCKCWKKPRLFSIHTTKEPNITGHFHNIMHVLGAFSMMLDEMSPLSPNNFGVNEGSKSKERTQNKQTVNTLTSLGSRTGQGLLEYNAKHVSVRQEWSVRWYDDNNIRETGWPRLLSEETLVQGLEESTRQQLDKGGQGWRRTGCFDKYALSGLGCCHDVTPWHVLLVSEQDIMRTITKKITKSLKINVAPFY